MPDFYFLNEAEEVEVVETKSNLNQNTIKVEIQKMKAERATAAP